MDLIDAVCASTRPYGIRKHLNICNWKINVPRSSVPRRPHLRTRRRSATWVGHAAATAAPPPCSFGELKSRVNWKKMWSLDYWGKSEHCKHSFEDRLLLQWRCDYWNPESISSMLWQCTRKRVPVKKMIWMVVRQARKYSKMYCVGLTAPTGTLQLRSAQVFKSMQTTVSDHDETEGKHKIIYARSTNNDQWHGWKIQYLRINSH